MGISPDPPGAGLVRRRQARRLHPLGPLLGAGVGAARARHPAAARQGRPQADAAGEPLRRVVPQLHADPGRADAAAPRPGLRGRLSLRQLRQDLRRRHGRGEPRRHSRTLPGVRRPLRGAHHEAPRRLRPVAVRDPAPGQGRVPRPPRPRRRSDRGRARPADAHGPLLLGRLRLAVQPGGPLQAGGCPARRPARSALRRVRHCALARADRPLPALGPVERHLVAHRPEPAPTLRVLLQHRGGRRHQRPLEGAGPGSQRGHRRDRAGRRRRHAGTLAVHPRRAQAPDLRRARSTATSARPSTTSCVPSRRANGSSSAASGTRSAPTATSSPATSSPRPA